MKTTIYFIAIMTLASFTSCKNQNKTKKETSMNPKSISKNEALKLVQPFYDFLGGDATPDQVQPSYHKDWVSYYNNTQGRTMEETVGFVSGPLSQMIPDLKWKIKEVYVTTDNTIIVRGEATGTPAGKSFMGSPISGEKPFKFMSIDIHELEEGKIFKTYHVEDWLNAIQQVTAE
jgi:hypothetical protein